MNAFPHEPLGRSRAERGALAARVAERLRSPSGIPRASRASPVAPSFAQEGIWIIDQLHPGCAAYNRSQLFRLMGPLQPEVLRRGFEQIVGRHEALRTGIMLRDGRARQVVRPPGAFPLSVVDLSGVPAETRLEEAEARALAFGTSSFDLSRDTLLRARLYRLAADEHVLLINTHHMGWDGWSDGVFWRELSAMVEALSSGAPPKLQPLSIQYTDFSAWQRTQADGARATSSIAYWRNRLEGAQPLNLPTRGPRPSRPTHVGAAHRFIIDRVLTARMKEVARAEGATLYMVALAAFKALLSRLAGVTDVITGTVVAGRSAAQLEPMIGCFVNALPLRTDLGGEVDFRGLLARVRETVLGAFEHEQLPFERIVSELRITRDPSRHPVFQTAFVLQNMPPSRPLLPGIRVEPIPQKGVTARFDLLLALTESGEGLQGRCEFSTGLFDPATVRGWMEAYVRLLDTATTLPQLPVHRIMIEPVSIPKEPPPREVVAGLSLPVQGCLHHLFERQVELTPDRIAVVAEREAVTYRELGLHADGLARELRRRGVGPDRLVALFLDRSAGMVAAIMGTLKAGGAYVPIDPGFPAGRVSDILADASPVCLVTSRSLSGRLPDDGPERVFIEDVASSVDGAPLLLPSEAGPGNLAYVIYTSGSTGRPKGVCIEHRSIVAYVSAVSARFGFQPGMSFATVSTIAADLGNTVVFPALVTGGCLHVISSERASSQAGLAAYFAEHGIDVLKIVPSHLAALQSGGPPELVMPRRFLILGGEASRTDWVRSLARAAPRCVIHNHYGPTEATVGVLTHRFDPDQAETPSGTLPLGRALPGAEVVILDQELRRVPAGVEGEICIQGPCLARGYLNRPDLTREKFVPVQVADGPIRPTYRTGDCGREMADGSIEFLGRIDDQLKIRGHRVEPGEVESVIREHPSVRAAAVVPRESPDGRKSLVAYVVPRRAHQAALANLPVYHLAAGLPVAHLNRNETEYIAREIFELGAYVRHGITVADGDCVIDAGANIGLFTVFASLQAERVRIIAFEPNPAAFECLQANAQAYNPPTLCLPFGLSDAERTGDLTVFEGLSLFSGIHADAEVEREVVRRYVANQRIEGGGKQGADDLEAVLDERFRARSVPAKLRRLSDVIDEYGLERIDLLKVNAEKSEYEILRGISAAHWPMIRQVVLEVDLASHREPIVRLLESHGFETMVEQDSLLRGTALCYVYGVRPSATRRLNRDGGDPSRHGLALRPCEPPLLPVDLRKCLEARLPDYMVPGGFVFLEDLPLTPNGKLDRQALPQPRGAPIPADAPARESNAVEATLAGIWRQVLSVNTVGLNDNFFELGGDSILAIQIANRARQAGLEISARQFFEHQTVAALAAVVAPSGAAAVTEGHEAAGAGGPYPVSPIQAWFFELGLKEPGHWNQCLVLEVDPTLDVRLVESALRATLRHHGALSLRFRDAGGFWEQEHASDDFAGVLEETDLSGMEQDAQDEAMAAIGKVAHAGLDVQRGPLVRAAFFQLGPGRRPRLLLAIHHLAVDNVSWSILLDDIETACRQLRIGRAVELPVVTAGYGVWCEHQLDLARSGAIDGDLAFWLAQTPVSPPLLLPDLSPRGANLEALAQSVAATLTKDETDHLLHGVTVGLDARVIEVLLAALVLTAREINGAGGVHLALEGHGREGPGDGLDVSRSVGWFTALFPVRLETPLSADGLETLGVVKQVLRSLPANGTTYGLLRHLLAGTAASEQLAGIPWPVLLFNYLGRAGAGIDPGACLRLATPGIISSRGAGNMRTHAHIVTAVVADSKLLIQWEYPGTLYRRATIETFVRCYVRQLRSLLELAPRQPRP